MTHIIVIAVERAKDPAEKAVAALIVAAPAALAVGSAAAPMTAGLPPLAAAAVPTNDDHQHAGPTVDVEAAVIFTTALKPQC